MQLSVILPWGKGCGWKAFAPYLYDLKNLDWIHQTEPFHRNVDVQMPLTIR